VAEPLLAVRGLTKRFGGLAANHALDLEVEAGEARAVIGPNGAGKTTLIAQLAGELRPDAGTIRFAGDDVTDWPPERRARRGLARSYQVTSVMPTLTALENVSLAARACAGRRPWLWRAAGAAGDVDVAARESLARVGLGARAGTTAGELSHGERRQLEIALALATAPRLLLLDEPTAGMGREESVRMIRLLADLKRRHTIVLVEHDMDVVFSVADRITVMDGGRPIATGTPEAIRRDPAVRAAYLGEAGDQGSQR
jgi:branched-chain amino acid transport system ATP-binding protein